MELAKTDPDRVERLMGGWSAAPDYVCRVEAGDVTYIMAQHTVIAAVSKSEGGEMMVDAGSFCSGPALAAIIDVELGEAFKAGLADPTSPQYLVLDDDRQTHILERMRLASLYDDWGRGALWSDIASHVIEEAQGSEEAV